MTNLYFKVGLYLLKKMESLEGKMMDLGLKGDTLLKLKEKNDEKLEFSSVKIMTTSFSHNV